jgi:hypothetical protein
MGKSSLLLPMAPIQPWPLSNAATRVAVIARRRGPTFTGNTANYGMATAHTRRGARRTQSNSSLPRGESRNDPTRTAWDARLILNHIRLISASVQHEYWILTTISAAATNPPACVYWINAVLTLMPPCRISAQWWESNVSGNHRMILQKVIR